MPARATDGTGQRGNTAPRHVWVDGDKPGVLLDWRRSARGWEAHVLYATGQQAVAQEWVAEGRVRPLDG